jgi:hypothetical protein
MTTRTPSLLRAARTSALVGLTGSAMPIAPASFLSTATKIAVAPSFRSASAALES